MALKASCLSDAILLQKFAEELFKRLNKSTGEIFEVRLAMMSVISRVTGVHKLLLLNFYPFLQRYMLPHQRDAPTLLAIMVQVSFTNCPSMSILHSGLKSSCSSFWYYFITAQQSIKSRQPAQMVTLQFRIAFSAHASVLVRIQQ